MLLNTGSTICRASACQPMKRSAGPYTSGAPRQHPAGAPLQRPCVQPLKLARDAHRSAWSQKGGALGRTRGAQTTHSTNSAYHQAVPKNRKPNRCDQLRASSPILGPVGFQAPAPANAHRIGFCQAAIESDEDQAERLDGSSASLRARKLQRRPPLNEPAAKKAAPHRTRAVAKRIVQPISTSAINRPYGHRSIVGRLWSGMELRWSHDQP
jgi:hypothetical protein